MNCSPVLRRPLGVVVSAVAVFCASLAIQPIARADETAPPVLWEGEIRTPDGMAADGADVVAYARPPAVSIQPGQELVEVARTTTDESGRFVLRAWPDTAMSMADKAGWATVMLTAFSRDGMSLAVDSVSFEPTPYSAKSVGSHPTRAGRWVTSPAERFREPGTYRAASVEDQVTTEAERPAVLVLEPGAKPEPGRFAAAAVPKARRGCWKVGEKDLGVRPVKVGELHLNRHWGGNFTYTSTRSSSFQIGVSQSGDHWKLGGSVSLGDEVSGESGGGLPARDADEIYLWDANMVFKRLSWGCGGEMNYYFIDTVEPVLWTGGMWQYPGTVEPPCNPSFRAPVGPNRYYERREGSSITFQAGIGVAGFSGDVTSAVSRTVTYRWDNTVNAHRFLCGSSAHLTRNTRVTSLA
jgi:hypothetical protein